MEELFHAKKLISLLRNFGHIALYKNILRFEIPSHSIHFFKRLPLLTKCGFQSFCYMYDRIFFFWNTILLQNLVTHSVHPTIFFSILSLWFIKKACPISSYFLIQSSLAPLHVCNTFLEFYRLVYIVWFCSFEGICLVETLCMSRIPVVLSDVVTCTIP